MHPSAEGVFLVPAVAVLYATVIRPQGVPPAAAAVALLMIFAAFFTGLQALATHTFLWAHLLQNVVLAEWAPALLVLAIPHEKAKRVNVPMLPALAVWLIVYFAWHLPWAYDYALRHQHSLFPVEHLTYLLAGIAVWWPVVHGPQNAGTKALYLFAAFVLASPIGLVLALVPRPIYDFYEHAPRAWGPGPLGDQLIAGVTMALERAFVFFAVFAYFLSRFLQEDHLSPDVFSRLKA